MHRYRALTWDHPRGYNALAAAARQATDFVIDWDRQPLEGFESHPIADLCARYDLVVLDHPHVGEAVAFDCLVPLEKVFGAEAVHALGTATIGPCLSSYRFAGRHWALPLDAASQVMASRPDLVPKAPTTWDEVAALSAVTGKVALSLAGPHAILSFFSIATALGEPPAVQDPDLLVSSGTGKAVFERLSELAARSPAALRDKNPIGILEHMAARDDAMLCPLVYGYVSYAAPRQGRPLRFSNAPRTEPDRCPGSTLGGTGIGISKRCQLSDELKRHLLWLMGEEAQTRFIPFHDGQPSRRSAWNDERVNARWGGFYSDTVATLEAAYVRPRYAGYIGFQNQASAYLRQAFTEHIPAATAVATLQSLYSAGRKPGSER